MTARRTGRDPRLVLREVAVLLHFRAALGGRDARTVAAAAVVSAAGFGLGVPLAVARLAPRDLAGGVTAVSTTLWTFFLLTALVTAVASAGGREVLGREARTVLPVSPAADQLGALALTPLNLVWSLQAVVLLCATGYAVGWQPVLPTALLATASWLVTATAVAQLLGWVAELARTYPAGPSALRLLAAAGLLLLAGLVLVADTGAVLDRLPTLWLFVGAVTTDPTRYLLTQALVVLVGVTAVVLTVPVAERLARRPVRAEASAETVRHARRALPARPVAGAFVLDSRSARRSPPVRRGLPLLLLAPLAAAALVPLPWPAVLVLPALVASGVALLHGVNGGALDGRGAVWRESLPWPADAAPLGRAGFLAAVTGAACALVVVVAAARTGSPPAPAQLVAACCAVLVATGQVVSRCTAWSVQRPFPAELRRARDTPAPPLAMARYSAVLSVTTTTAGLLLAAAASAQHVTVVLALTCLLLAPAALRLHRGVRRHRHLAVRSRVASTVAGGGG